MILINNLIITITQKLILKLDIFDINLRRPWQEKKRENETSV